MRGLTLRLPPDGEGSPGPRGPRIVGGTVTCGELLPFCCVGPLAVALEGLLCVSHTLHIGTPKLRDVQRGVSASLKALEE